MESIFENLENLNVSEECFNEIIDIVEEIINEVSVKRWKEAAKNSIEYRKDKERGNDAERDAYIGDMRKDYPRMKRPLEQKFEKEYQDRANYLSDRTSRAEYLSRNLPDSSKSASKVKTAAEKASDSRTKKADKLYNKFVEKQEKAGPVQKRYYEENNKKEYAKSIDKKNERARNYNVIHDREMHAREVANKPLIGDNGKPEVGHYMSTNPTSYKEDHRTRAERVEKAEKNLNKVFDQHVDKMGDDEFDSHRDAIRYADDKVTKAKKAVKDAHLSHKV